jgi:hypothetical protein
MTVKLKIMTFAYLILAHKNLNQVLRLVNALTTGDTYFVIHVDRNPLLKPGKMYFFVNTEKVLIRMVFL